MTQLFHVQHKVMGKNGKPKWVNVKRKWRGKRTDSFSFRVAKKLTRRLRNELGDRNIRMKAVQELSPKARKRQRERALIAKWLRGDLDAQHKLMYRLALVAQELGHTLYIAEGKRSIADQWKYWNAFKAGKGPLAAYPGTSNHTWGNAADVRKDAGRWSGNLGDIPGARDAMKKWGLCLPVPGETWHAEIGNSWRA